MLSNIIESLKHVFEGPSEQQKLDDYIAQQHPTSVGDVEYWIKQYDRKQFTHSLISNATYHYR